jgi:hypothetical protein
LAAPLGEVSLDSTFHIGDLLGGTALINSMYLRLLLIFETEVNANDRSGDAKCATKQTNQGIQKAANQTKNLF